MDLDLSGSISRQQLELVEKQRQESKAEIEQLTAEDLQVFRNQLRSKVEEDVDMDTKKSVLSSLIKKMEVNQDGLVEIDFCVALGNTLYPICSRYEFETFSRGKDSSI